MEEDSLLLEKVRELGKRWGKMTPFFKGRTDLQLKTRWGKIVKRGGSVAAGGALRGANWSGVEWTRADVPTIIPQEKEMVRDEVVPKVNPLRMSPSSDIFFEIGSDRADRDLFCSSSKDDDWESYI
jgi:hypothetical protein